MGSERDRYAWLVLQAMRRWKEEEGGGTMPSWLMLAVEAIAGTLRNPPATPANDQAASCLLLLLLFLA